MATIPAVELQQPPENSPERVAEGDKKTLFMRSKEWVSKHKKGLAIGAVALAILGGSIALYNHLNVDSPEGIKGDSNADAFNTNEMLAWYRKQTEISSSGGGSNSSAQTDGAGGFGA